jgi:hypothetical protein
MNEFYSHKPNTYIVRERPVNLKGVFMGFLSKKKNILIPNVAEKIF